MIFLKQTYTSSFIKLIGICFVFIFVMACNEKYNFNVKNQKEGIVVEAFISNRSFAETLGIPSDGRYFQVILRKTNDVDNVRDEKISNASVILHDDRGQEWKYTEVPLNPGIYELRDEFVKASPGIGYQLTVELLTGQKFESAWEKMPEVVNEMGQISFKEVTRQIYTYQQEEKVITDEQGLDIYMDIPENRTDQTRHLIWNFDPMWTYAAALAEDDFEGKHCWVTSSNYLKNTELQEDKKGGYLRKLFNLKTVSNERVYDYFTAIIHQHAVTPGYYFFWKDLNGQREKGGLYDQPPFSVSTNFRAVNNDWSTNGYFAVTDEQFVRWELDKSQLSYFIEDDLEYFCRLYYEFDPEGLDSCVDCRVYPRGTAINHPPAWWQAKYGRL